MFAARRCSMFAVLALAEISFGQPPQPLPIAPPPRLKPGPIDVAGMIRKPANEAIGIARMYEVDRAALLRNYAVPASPVRTERLRKFDADWLARLKSADFSTMTPAAREAAWVGRCCSGWRLWARWWRTDGTTPARTTSGAATS